MDNVMPTEGLARRLDDPSLVLLHVGSEKDYLEGHIPGARLVRLQDISMTDATGLRLQLPDTRVLQDAFEKLGVSDGSRIVVYAGTDSVQSATRVWFTLDYLGLADRTALLDGGLSLWRAEGRPVSTEAPPSVKAGSLTPRVRREAVVDAEWIRGTSGVALVDARLPEFYTGSSAGNMPRGGRIPGARNVPFSSFFTPEGKLKDRGALREMMPEGSTIVTYCHIGQQATVPYFVARYLGVDVKLYDGSFQDWSRRAELPVETGP